jgi:hypothetical protein
MSRSWSGQELRSENRPDPVQRSVTTGVVMDQERPVCLEHQEPHRFREACGQASRVEDFAAGDDEAHSPRTY